MPGNSKTSKWRSTPQTLRKRKAIKFTLSDEAIQKLNRLTRNASGMRSSIVERLILEAPDVEED